MECKPDGNYGLKVLFLAAEAFPFIKVGGLGDYAGSLPLSVVHSAEEINLHVDFKIILPAYKPIIEKWDCVPISTINFVYGQKKETAIVLADSKAYPQHFFIQKKNQQPPSQVYTADAGKDGDIFAFTSLAALEFVKHIKWQPDIIHVNDWHTAFAAKKAQMLRKTDQFFQKTRIVLSLHNLPFMGAGAETIIEKLGLVEKDVPGLPFWGKNQPLPIGLSCSDHIVVVSPGYASEIQTSRFGCGLQTFLKIQRNKITGILNGIDTNVWDPLTDPVCHHYSAFKLENKQKNKVDLLKLTNLKFKEKTPLFVTVSRLDWQKGIDLLLDAFKIFSAKNWQLIILGAGGKDIEQACKEFEIKHPEKVRFFAKFDPDLSRLIYAGGDFFVMPSRYEPCGLSQMIALRYGTIPIAAKVGGLKDTIKIGASNRTGFLFKPSDKLAMVSALDEATNLFNNGIEHQAMQIRAMQEDYSWSKSAKKYLALYRRLAHKNGI